MLGTHLPIFSTHLLTCWHKISQRTVVGRCVLKCRPTVGLIPPTNADSNVESAVSANPQSALDKDISIVGCDESRHIPDDESAGMCWFFHNSTVSLTWPIRKHGTII